MGLLVHFLDVSWYSFIRDLRVMEVGGVKTWVVLARSHNFTNIPEKDGVIRVDEFQQACVMQSDGKVGSRGVGACMWVYVCWGEEGGGRGGGRGGRGGEGRREGGRGGEEGGRGGEEGGRGGGREGRGEGEEEGGEK